MPDQSELDKRYFIDEYVYNCPFCNRRNVAYFVASRNHFDWAEEKPCHAYFVECESCECRSMHLTFEDLDIFHYATVGKRSKWRFQPPADDEGFLDEAFFYSVPTSFFVLDERVPRNLRELLTEAEGCLKSNFLTGSSACARKIVYELAIREEASGDNYDERIKSLKKKHPNIEPTFFDTLLTIQQVTSSKVHENSYDGWQAKHLRIILASISEVLHELYVVPAIRKDRRESILSLKSDLIGDVPAAPGEADERKQE